VNESIKEEQEEDLYCWPEAVYEEMENSKRKRNISIDKGRDKKMDQHLVKRPKAGSRNEYKKMPLRLSLSPEQMAKMIGIEEPFRVDNILYDNVENKFHISAATFIHDSEYEEKRKECFESELNLSKVLYDKIGDPYSE
jgi:hypothetical protein